MDETGDHHGQSTQVADRVAEEIPSLVLGTAFYVFFAVLLLYDLARQYIFGG